MAQRNPPNQNVLETFYRSKTVKTLALIDIFFSLFYFLFSPYLLIGNIVGLLFSYIGYHGAKMFDKSYTFTYLVYNICKTLISIIFPIVLFCYVNFPASVIVLSVLIMLLNIYITLFIYKFYNSLKNCTDYELQDLRILNYPVTIIIW